ncbi:MAG: tetratricopeptide repeat protein [Burkholderiaceae bacterium]|nr:tetratricopeptide repeat protein [Burkholderiaceae bacterium]
MQTVPSKFILSLLVAFVLSLSTAQAATLDQASALLDAGHLTQADHVLAQVLADQPHSAQAHYLEARLLAAEGKWPLAEQELELAQRLDPTLSFAPVAQSDALAKEVLQHQWKNPSGFAGYGQAALAALFVLISGYLVFGVMRHRRRLPNAQK